METATTTFCPICNSEVTPSKGKEAEEIDCQRHGRFKVSATVFATSSLMEAGQEQWEAALKSAQARQPNESAPCVLTTDFNFAEPI
jgi:hypothetical protein